MDRFFFRCAAVAGLVGVALGAFAAHALKARLSPELLAAFETGVRYQMYHVFALLAVALAWTRGEERLFAAAGWLFLAGMLVFSGSLYLLALTGVRGLGAITPLGGLAFLAGWLCLALGARTRLRT